MARRHTQFRELAGIKKSLAYPVQFIPATGFNKQRPARHIGAAIALLAFAGLCVARAQIRFAEMNAGNLIPEDKITQSLKILTHKVMPAFK